MSECMQVAFLSAENVGTETLIKNAVGKTQFNGSQKDQTIYIPKLSKNLVIMDTGDLYNFPPMRRVTIQMSKAFVLVYNINSKKSFDEIEYYYNDIMEIKESSIEESASRIPLVVVALSSSEKRMELEDLENCENKVKDTWQRKHVKLESETDSKALLTALEEEILTCQQNQKNSNKDHRQSLSARVGSKLKAVVHFRSQKSADTTK